MRRWLNAPIDDPTRSAGMQTEHEAAIDQLLNRCLAEVEQELSRDDEENTVDWDWMAARLIQNKETTRSMRDALTASLGPRRLVLSDLSGVSPVLTRIGDGLEGKLWFDLNVDSHHHRISISYRNQLKDLNEARSELALDLLPSRKEMINHKMKMSGYEISDKYDEDIKRGIETHLSSIRMGQMQWGYDGASDTTVTAEPFNVRGKLGSSVADFTIATSTMIHQNNVMGGVGTAVKTTCLLLNVVTYYLLEAMNDSGVYLTISHRVSALELSGVSARNSELS